MKRLKMVVAVAVLTMAGVAAAVPAWAQPGQATAGVPKAEVGLGYQYMRVEGDNLNQGAFADVAINATKNFSVVGQLSGSRKSMSETSTFGSTSATVDADMSLIQFLGGLRFSSRSEKGIVPFVQALAGGVRLGAKATGTVAGVSQTIDESDTEFGVQLGAGFNIAAGKRISIRVAGDYLRVLHKDEDATNFIRATAGIVIPIGKR
jgi:opacity protein-like surface antigen